MNPVIKKVPVQAMLELLTYLYDKGADYVDISGIIEENKEHTLIISIEKEYMQEEYLDNYEDIVHDETDSNVKLKLSDEDLNDLV